MSVVTRAARSIVPMLRRPVTRGAAVRAAADTPHLLLGAPVTASRPGYPELGGFDPEAVVTPGIHVSAVVRIPRVATQAGGFKTAA